MGDFCGSIWGVTPLGCDGCVTVTWDSCVADCTADCAGEVGFCCSDFDGCGVIVASGCWGVVVVGAVVVWVLMAAVSLATNSGLLPLESSPLDVSSCLNSRTFILLGSRGALIV